MQMVAFLGLFKDEGLFFQEAGEVELSLQRGEWEVFTDGKLEPLNLSTVFPFFKKKHKNGSLTVSSC